MRNDQQQQLTRRFREVAWGRLYWKRNNSTMQRFDSDDVCIVKNGTVTTHYKSLDAFLEDVKEAEQSSIPPDVPGPDEAWLRENKIGSQYDPDWFVEADPTDYPDTGRSLEDLS